MFLHDARNIYHLAAIIFQAEYVATCVNDGSFVGRFQQPYRGVLNCTGLHDGA